MPQKPVGRDDNPFGLNNKYKSKMPPKGTGGEKCSLEINTLYDCLENNDFDRGACSEYVDAVDSCMKMESMRRKPSTNYHMMRIIRNKYRIPANF